MAKVPYNPILDQDNGRKVILKLRHVDVKFNVRGRILNAIRDVSLQIYEGESIAIVGESGSGKSVLTKTFAGMLDSNGFISHGKIIFSDDDLSVVHVENSKTVEHMYKRVLARFAEITYHEGAREEYVALSKLKEEHLRKISLNAEEQEVFDARLKEVNDDITDLTNLIQTLDPHNKEDRVTIKEKKAQLKETNKKKKELLKEIKSTKRERKTSVKKDTEYMKSYHEQVIEFTKKYHEKVHECKEKGLSEEQIQRNIKATEELILSIYRFPIYRRLNMERKILKNFDKAALNGKDIAEGKQLDKIYGDVTFRVDFKNKDEHGNLEGYTIIDCARIKYTKDWQKIRGTKIATVFQDPMTSLNPIIPIGKQITTVIQKHQKCGAIEAKRRALDIMGKVGIPHPELRFNDYPFQYSGGMRQRIVIAIALSCQPKILICDEPTTALDVTIQAQIVRLIRDLGKELGFTTVYITHDLGVVANVAERVAVLYGGQIVELGTVEDIFYDPRHPYTWALLSSLPQLSQKGSELFSISGTPPSLYNKIVGDAFAPRSQYAMAIDFVKEPPMFQISDTHFAKTWLLDPRAPKVEKPEIIRDLHAKMKKVYKIEED